MTLRISYLTNYRKVPIDSYEMFAFRVLLLDLRVIEIETAISEICSKEVEIMSAENRTAAVINSSLFQESALCEIRPRKAESKLLKKMMFTLFSNGNKVIHRLQFFETGRS